MLDNVLNGAFAVDGDQRGTDRRRLRLTAQASGEAESALVIHNLSRTGMLVQGAADVSVGSEIEVELPGGTSHRAEVVWADETLLGCRFASPLTQAQHSAALLRSVPHDSAPSARPKPLTQAEAMAKLREHWDEEPEPEVRTPNERSLPLGTRLWIICGLGLTGWAVPAAAAWVFG